MTANQIPNVVSIEIGKQILNFYVYKNNNVIYNVAHLGVNITASLEILPMTVRVTLEQQQ